MFAGTIGVYTGMRGGNFSISVNQRATQEIPCELDNCTFGVNPIGLVENLAMVFYGEKEISWLVRDTLEYCSDFNCAYNKTRSENIASLGHIILAGTKEYEGVVITRNRHGIDNENQLNDT
jgi:hypothetical protein